VWAVSDNILHFCTNNVQENSGMLQRGQYSFRYSPSLLAWPRCSDYKLCHFVDVFFGICSFALKFLFARNFF
jgi:hypothetical protein